MNRGRRALEASPTHHRYCCNAAILLGSANCWGSHLFDLDLHIRFLQKATDAFCEFGQASVAAAVAWQDRLHETEPVPAWQAAASTWQNLALAGPMAALGAGLTASPPSALELYWALTPWSYYRGPLMAMMLSYGVPYSVAAPTARGSTSAMDAADAAYLQWRLVFANCDINKSGPTFFAGPASTRLN